MNKNEKGGIRSTLKELKFRMREEGESILVLVEGPSDVKFMRAFLHAHEGVRYHSVAHLEIPPDKLGDHGKYGNNRSLVIAAIDAYGSDDSVRIAGFIDRDCGIDESIEGMAGLFVTDFPALESYACNPSTMVKIFSIMMELDDAVSRVRKFPEHFGEALASMYSYRSVHGNPSPGSSDMTGYFRASGDVVSLRVASLPADWRVEGVGATTWPDVQKVCYGHDLASVLLARFANLVKNKLGFKDHSRFERTMMGYIDTSHLPEDSAIERLEKWIVKS